MLSTFRRGENMKKIIRKRAIFKKHRKNIYNSFKNKLFWCNYNMRGVKYNDNTNCNNEI